MRLLAETFRTDRVARPQRLSFWNEVAASTFGDIAIDAPAESLAAELTRLRYGELTLASVASSPARVSGARASRASEGWFLLLNERGVSRMRQGTREVWLQPGELTVLRADQQYLIDFSRPNRTLVLHVPGSTAGVDFESRIARKHGPENAPLVIALLRQLEISEPGADVPRLARLALEAARLSWPTPAHRNPTKQSILIWERRIREHVERHLCDPDLSARSIARHFDITPRFVHMAFAHGGCTVGAFILDRRLTLAAARLRADPACSVTAIAFDCGLSDLSHFCRVFRRRFGVSATDYRRAP